MTDDLARYHRQMLLPGFGEQGQHRLLNSTALVLGCGALGTVVANILARAGVGHLVIVDRDFIELTNLQRQVLYDERDVADAIPKAQAARRRLAQINSQIKVTAIVDDINHTNFARYAAGADVLIDGVDNFETRYLANDYAVSQGIPYVYGGAVGTVGMSYTILPHSRDGNTVWEQAPGGSKATPCFRCLFEQAPPPGMSPTCDTSGVLGPVVSLIADFQAAEALKILTGNFDRVSPTLLNVDLWTNTITQLKVNRIRDEGDCPCCKQHNFEHLEGKSGTRATTLCGRNAVQLTYQGPETAIDLSELAGRLRSQADVRQNEFMLRASLTDNGKPYELTVFANGRAIVKGTDEARVARSIYARYVGG